MSAKFLTVLSTAALMAGCASYRWTPSVPTEMRTVAVPTFRNDTSVTELGNVVTRQILREFQREGTFKIARVDDAALEIQGAVTGAGSSFAGADRTAGRRHSMQHFTVKAVVSVVDHRKGKVLVNNRTYEVSVPFGSDSDLMTGRRNASGRVAEELATRIVDDVLSQKW